MSEADKNKKKKYSIFAPILFVMAGSLLFFCVFELDMRDSAVRWLIILGLGAFIGGVVYIILLEEIMIMNERQLTAMWIGIIIIVVMCIFPPWYQPNMVKGTHSKWGYSFVFTPPEVNKSIYVMINMPQLFIQCVIVGLITTGYIITLNYKKPKDEQKE